MRVPALAQRTAIAVALAAILAVPTSAQAQFPGQNGAIAYTYMKYDKRLKDWAYFGMGSLYTVFPDGSGATALPDDATYDDLEPAWSPDGIQLAWASIGPAKYTGIYAGPVGSTTSKLLAKAKSPDAPAWAPGGTSLAYVDFAKGILSIDTAPGAKPKLLLRNPKGASFAGPVYSADGTALYFSREQQTKSGTYISEIWAADPSGANARKVLGGAGALLAVYEPDVSPDGKQLVFAAGSHGKEPGGIWVANVDGSALRKVASPPGSQFYTGPAWSPDGALIVAALQRKTIKQGGSIVTIDPTTGARQTLRTMRKAYMGNVSWQPQPSAIPTG